MPVKLQIRRGTAAQWTSANPVLLAGEQGLETDTRKVKIGDGTTAWNSLAYSIFTQAELDAKAPLASPALTGTPTAPTAAGATNTTQIATTAFVQTAVGTRAPTASPTFTGTSTFDAITATGTARFQEIIEDIVDVAHASNVLTLDYNSGNIFYMATAFAASPAVTVNITNAPTTDGRVFTVILFAVQGATGYNPTTLNINGSAATIRWAGGTAPTPTNGAGKIDIYSFTAIRRSAAWTVLASAATNF